MKIRPPATIGVPCVCVPSGAIHWMFLPVSRSNESGRPRSAETIFRDHASPHWGWSAPVTAPVNAVNARSGKAQCGNFMEGRGKIPGGGEKTLVENDNPRIAGEPRRTSLEPLVFRIEDGQDDV